MARDEVVQIYIGDTATDATCSALRLVGFVRVAPEPDASAVVRASIPMALLGYVGLTGDLLVEEGPVTLEVGSASDELGLSAQIEGVGGTTARTEDNPLLATVRVS